MKSLLSFARLALSAGLILTMPGLSFAQSYPSKPIRLVVPFPPGGGVDIYARVLGAKLTDTLGQKVMVENLSGAGGTIGSNNVAKAPPDGYTLLMATFGTLAVSVSLYPNLPYDPTRDFAPVTLLLESPLVLVVNPSVPAKSVKELIALAKSKPGQLTFAGVPGGGLQLAGELFKAMAGVNILYVPYKGGGPAALDLLGGHVNIMFDNISNSVPFIKAGRLRALAVTTSKRVAALPDLPTVAEAGVPGFEFSTWYGLVAPAGTPQSIVDRLNSEIVKIMGMQDVRERMIADGVEPATSTPNQFAELIKTEIAKWGKLVKDAGIRAD